MERKRGIYVKTVVILAVVLACNAFLFRDILQNTAFQGLARPFVFLEKRLSNSHVSQLIKERDALLGKIVDDEALARENAALRRQLQAEGRSSRKTVAVHIIAMERTPLLSSLLIDRGTSEGVEKGMIVVAPGNIFAGRIEETFSHTSRVRLADDLRSSISVRILETSLLAELKGALRNSAEVNLISHADKIETDAILVTSGLDGYPEALAVAKITDAAKGGNSLFQSVHAALLFDAAQSPLLFVLQ